MSGLASKVWGVIVGWQTGRDESDAYARDKYNQRIEAYNSHFDRSLTKGKGKYDEKRDAEKIKQRIEGAQEMTNAVSCNRHSSHLAPLPHCDATADGDVDAAHPDDTRASPALHARRWCGWSTLVLGSCAHCLSFCLALCSPSVL